MVKKMLGLIQIQIFHIVPPLPEKDEYHLSLIIDDVQYPQQVYVDKQKAEMLSTLIGIHIIERKTEK